MRPAAIAALALVLAAGCKDKLARDRAPDPAPAGEAARGSARTPTVVTVGHHISVDEVKDLLPRVTGDLVEPLTATADQSRVHAAWCVAAPSVDSATSAVAAAFTAANWTEVTTHPAGERATIGATRDGLVARYVVDSSTIVSCAAPTHYLVNALVYRQK